MASPRAAWHGTAPIVFLSPPRCAAHGNATRSDASHRIGFMPERAVQKRLSELVRDDTIFPRQTTDALNVAQLTTAINDGESLPPLIIDQDARLLDGWHRYEAYLAVHGPGYEVACKVVECANDYEALVEAARLNWRHGQRLSDGDKAHAASLVECLGMTATQFASDLGTPVAAVKRLSDARVARRADAASGLRAARPATGAFAKADSTTPGEGRIDEGVLVRNCTQVLKNRALAETDASKKLVLGLYVESKAWLLATKQGVEVEAA